MPVLGQRTRKKFRGVIRARIKKAKAALHSILAANTKASTRFLTTQEQDDIETVEALCGTLLNTEINY